MTQGIGTFFSYAREDSDFALRLASDLRKRGVDVWLDQLDIPAGAAWDRAIEQAISSCGRMLIILSPKSVTSENVMDEVSFALDQGDRVVPVLLQPCEVPLRMRRLQYIDFTQDYAASLDKLARSLAGPTRSDPSEPASPVPEPATDSSHVARRSEPEPPSRRTRKKLFIAVAAAIAVIAVIALVSRASKPRRQDNRRQTATAGTGMVVVPSVLGVAQELAMAVLERQKLEPRVVGTEQTCGKPEGAVVSQDPAGMTQAKVGSRVSLVVEQRSPIPIPDAGANKGMTVLAPGAGHAAPGRDNRRTRVDFMLAGSPCAKGTVVVSHPTAGREIYELAAGEKGSRNIVYGAGKIIIDFASPDRDARLVVRSD